MTNETKINDRWETNKKDTITLSVDDINTMIYCKLHQLGYYDFKLVEGEIINPITIIAVER